MAFSFLKLKPKLLVYFMPALCSLFNNFCFSLESVKGTLLLSCMELKLQCLSGVLTKKNFQAFHISVNNIEIVLYFSSLLPPALPPANRFSTVAVDAISIAIVAFAINYSLARLFALKHGYSLVPNQVSVL